MKRSRLTDALQRGFRPTRLRPRRHRHAETLPQSAEQLEVRTLLSAEPILVEDINPGGDSDPREFTEVNGTVFFTAYDNVNGRELWMTDGTETRLVMDINEGVGGSFPAHLTNVNGTLYFTADDGEHGTELWQIDGTTPRLVTDLRTGEDGSSPSNLTNVDGTLFFSANDGESGQELWQIDGSTPRLVKDIDEGPANSSPRVLTEINGTLFFMADDGEHGRELWKTDGTDTSMVMDINDGPADSDPLFLGSTAEVNGTLFFTANDGSNGIELWQTDGADTRMVKDINAGGNDSIPMNLINVNGTLFFTAFDDEHGWELWQSDGTTTSLVEDIYPGPDGSDAGLLGGFAEVNGTLFFSANDGQDGYELWQSDGTATRLVKDIHPGGDSFPGRYMGFTEVDGTVYSAADDGEHGRELWQTDGTETRLVRDINPTGSSNPYYLTLANGTLFFTADDGEHGRELWMLAENAPPTDVALENTTTELEENTDTSAPIKVGEIVVTDDGVGTSTFGLTGTDQEFFEIIGNELFLKAGTTLDFETQDAYAVTVEVTDLDLGSGPHATTDFTLNILDVNEAPTAVTLENVVDTIEENSDTSTRIKVADIVITDDALGTNTLTLSGADAASFEIIGNELFLRAGVTLDFETQTQLDVTANVTDTDLGSGPHATTDFTLNITDIDERPPLVRLVWSIFGWKVKTVRSYVPSFFRRW